MLRFILNRLFLFVPTLLLVSVIAFVLSLSTPGDPVDRLLQSAEKGEVGAGNITRMNRDLEAKKLRERLGLNLPMFYLSIQTLADIDTLYKLNSPLHRPALKRMARETGNPQLVMKWYGHVIEASNAFDLASTDSTKSMILSNYQEQSRAAQSLFNGILLALNKESQEIKKDSLSNLLSLIPEIRTVRSVWEVSLNEYANSYKQSATWKKYIPRIFFYGINNQYHRWLFGKTGISKGVIRGDFGISFRDGQKISDRLGKAMKWTVFLSLISMILAFSFSIPLGLFAGNRANGRFDTISSLVVFALYALPGFFVASLLLVLFANPDFFDWFPSSGVKDPELFNPNWSLNQRLQHYFPYLILPLISLTYASFAYISRQVRAGVIDAYSMDYVKTARAKGLKESAILFKHIFPNILFPLITIFGQTLPIIFSGSVIIESIFNIPGMGLEMYESVVNFDYPMIIAIFTLIGLLTILGYLVSDILYAIADPRVKFRSSNK